MASLSSVIKHLNRPKIGVILMFIFFLTILYSFNSGADESLPRGDMHTDGEGLRQRKMVLGSKPPECVNKCLSCRPCMAALVISQHQKNVKALPQEPESYYLLAWKCKCRDKFFQP